MERLLWNFMVILYNFWLKFDIDKTIAMNSFIGFKVPSSRCNKESPWMILIPVLKVVGLNFKLLLN